MKRFSILVLLALLGLNVVSCRSDQNTMDDIQREEGPVDEAGEEMKDAADDVEDKMD